MKSKYNNFFYFCIIFIIFIFLLNFISAKYKLTKSYLLPYKDPEATILLTDSYKYDYIESYNSKCKKIKVGYALKNTITNINNSKYYIPFNYNNIILRKTYIICSRNYPYSDSYKKPNFLYKWKVFYILIFKNKEPGFKIPEYDIFDYNNNLIEKNVYCFDNIDYKNINYTVIELKNITNNIINLILFKTDFQKDVKYTDISIDYKIDKKDHNILRMEINGNKFIFRNGSYWCFINNKTYKMSGNCIIKNGKLQLPQEFYKKIKTKNYHFFQTKEK